MTDIAIFHVLLGEAKTLESDLAHPPAPPRKPPLNNGGGDGRFPHMEARVTKLEEHVANIRVDVGIIKTELTHKPGKGFIVTAATGTVAALTGLMILLQHLGLMH